MLPIKQHILEDLYDPSPLVITEQTESTPNKYLSDANLASAFSPVTPDPSTSDGPSTSITSEHV